jgi:ABC-type glycerol-3-phosphate transport system permease component
MAAAHIQPSGVADAGIAGETAGPPPVRRKRKLGSGVEIVLLTLFAVVMLFPVIWMLETALKDTKDIYAVPAKLITGWTPTFDHVKDVFSSDSPVFKGFKNSVIVAVSSTVIATVLGVPAEYEEAAMLDGFSRFEAFWRVTMPLLIPGIAATAVFALIFSWNEFVFSIFLITDPDTRTAPSAIAGLIGGTTIDWGLVAASAMIFAIPVLLFAFLVRKHLVAGVTLGAVRR